MSTILLCAIVLAFTLIHFIETCGYSSRIAGQKLQSNSLGYSLQQATFIVTRFFFLLFLPLLGLTIDLGIDKSSYYYLVLACLFGAGLASAIVLAYRRYVVAYYISAISMLMQRVTLPVCLLKAFSNAKPLEVPMKMLAFHNKAFFLSLGIYTFFSSSVFISFYLSLNYEDYRLFFAQLSGVVNGVGSILLSFYLDPMFSRVLDSKNEEESRAIYESVIIGRITALIVIAPILFTFIYMVPIS